MIDALISGKLYGKPAQRTGASGRQFVVAKVRVAIENGDSIFISVIVFSTTAGAALLALDDGDSVALSGSITPKLWTDRDGNQQPGIDMVGASVMTAYGTRKKRAAIAQADEPAPAAPGEQMPHDPLD